MPRRTKRRTGRPSLLTPDRQAKLFEIVKKGNHLTTACAVVGIGVSTMYRWLEQADDAEAQTEDPNAPDLTDAQRVYLEFRDGLRLARAHAEMRAVSVIERAMDGGFVVSERPIQDSNGDVQYGPDGEVLYERTFTQPDGRLALNYLARSSPSMWGQNPTHKVEIHGAGAAAGGAGDGEMTDDQAVNLARQLATVAERVREDEERDRLELEAGVQDAEIVEDESA